MFFSLKLQPWQQFSVPRLWLRAIKHALAVKGGVGGGRDGGSSSSASKLLPKYVAKLQLECLLHCATQSHFLQGADAKICVFLCQDAIFNTLIHSVLAVSKSTLDVCYVLVAYPQKHLHPCLCALTAETLHRCCCQLPPPPTSHLHLLE